MQHHLIEYHEMAFRRKELIYGRRERDLDTERDRFE